jgi:hypothetical protein
MIKLRFSCRTPLAQPIVSYFVASNGAQPYVYAVDFTLPGTMVLSSSGGTFSGSSSVDENVSGNLVVTDVSGNFTKPIDIEVFSEAD